MVGGGENVRAITVPSQSNCTSARVAPAGKTSRMLLTSNLSHSPRAVVDGSLMVISATGNGEVLVAVTSPETRDLSPSTA